MRPSQYPKSQQQGDSVNYGHSVQNLSTFEFFHIQYQFLFLFDMKQKTGRVL